MQFNIFKALKPLLEKEEGHCRILITLVAQYLSAKCCEDPDHIPNYCDSDYKKTIKDGLFECKKLAKGLYLQTEAPQPPHSGCHQGTQSAGTSPLGVRPCPHLQRRIQVPG